LKTSNRPHGKMADMPNSTLNFKFGSIFGSTSQLYVPATPANFLSPLWECLADIEFDSHRSIGIQSCPSRDRYVTALPANPHHPHAPWEGRIADAHLASTLACATANPSVNYTGGACHRDTTETLKTSHLLDGRIADALASTHACTTVNASVNYSRYVPQRP
jgi:hypothetical protein